MAELSWASDSGIFALVKWLCFLGLFIEACKIAFSTIFLLRTGTPVYKAVLMPFVQQPERIFVIGILIFYARLLGKYTPLWLQDNPEWLFVNVAYAGYWMLRAVPVFWYRKGRRRSDSLIATEELRTRLHPTHVR